MTTEHNKEIVRKYIEEVLSDFDYTHFDDYLHDDFAAYPGGNLLDKAGHRNYFGAMRERTPDMRNTLQEMLAEGNKVVAISVWTGNNPAEPDKKPSDITDLDKRTIAVYTFKDGKIVHGVVYR